MSFTPLLVANVVLFGVNAAYTAKWVIEGRYGRAVFSIVGCAFAVVGFAFALHGLRHFQTGV